MTGKMKSRRFWVVIWAILYVSGFTWYGIKENNAYVWASIALVAGIVISWMTVTSMKKKKDGE